MNVLKDVLVRQCATHADRLRVPVGWDRNDRRPPLPVRPPIAV
jgi:hypothetical protein